MSKVTVDEMVSEILKIEKDSIREYGGVISSNTVKYGKNKSASDVINKILNIIELGGIGDED